MNYIARLQAELAAANATIAAKSEAIQAFRVHLSSEKFTGFEPDGSRKDWIATRDVNAWLTRIAEADGNSTSGT